MRFFLTLGLVLVLLGTSQAQIESVGPIGITVKDLDRSVQFFTDVLEFEKVREWESAGNGLEHLQGVFGARQRTARLRLGGEEIELTQYLTPRGEAFPWGTKPNDAWFQHIAIVVSDMDKAYARLREAKVEHASPSPQTLPDWNPNAGGIKAFYFRDPDGHFLELISFPQDKGNPKWRKPEFQDSLFLGIDHTAIVVDDTEDSLRFFRDLLGFEVAGTSENYGIEQERLNNVFGAHLRITGLKVRGGPGLELLEYLSPGTGRKYPADASSNDLLHWQTSLETSDPSQLSKLLGGQNWLSSGIVDRRFIVRGPDGHAFVIDGRQTHSQLRIRK